MGPTSSEYKSSFQELFLPQLDAAYNLAYWVVDGDQDAQDIVQEAYVRAFKGFSGFRGNNPRAWLLTIGPKRQSRAKRYDSSVEKEGAPPLAFKAEAPGNSPVSFPKPPD